MKKKKEYTEQVGSYWRVHTPNLLSEVLNNKGTWALTIPIKIFGHLLAELGEIANKINDKELNKMMLRLTIYSVADPESKDYDADFVAKYLES